MWQWYDNNNWVQFGSGNQLKLSEREQQPSLEPISLLNDVGEIFGCPENDHMHFRLVGEEEAIRTFVRRGPKPKEKPVYVVVEQSLRHVLPYEAGGRLFRNGKPYKVRKECHVGTEHYVAEGGHLYKMTDGQLQRLQWQQTDLSKSQVNTMTKTRYLWEFKGAFRLERMRTAVVKTASELEDASASQALTDAFEQFDPNLDVTEHGPYQFNDFLVSRELHGLAIQVMENYHADEPRDWKAFDALTNARIESARSEGRCMANITVRGHQYVIIFDSGSGASGQPPVVIRPLRYERILTSIEENFGRAHLKKLYESLTEIGCNPRLFMMALMSDTNRIDLIPEEHQERILNLIRSSSMGTALQNQLPPLLEKYKECDIRLSSIERLSPKPLERRIKQTLVTGLRVPDECHNVTFEDMIDHISSTQSWVLDKGGHTCDICSVKTTVLNHCGSAKACLKCWTDSLSNSEMCCPFCRQEVVEKQLTVVMTVPERPKKTRGKRKREHDFVSAEEVLQEIQKDSMYSHFQLDDNQTMRKWFVVLMRRGMLKNGRLPRNMQAKKSLRSALQEFNILN